MKYIFNKIIDSIEIMLLGILLFCTVYFFIGQLVSVSGDSMEPTFKNEEQLLVEKVSVNLSSIKRGDVVVFNSIGDDINPSHLLIKRIVGLPNETIKIQDGYVYIDGQKISESYLTPDTYTYLKSDSKMKEGEEYKIGQNSYVVLGDNRDNSVDSRTFGSINKENILGKVVLIYYPIKNFRLFR